MRLGGVEDMVFFVSHTLCVADMFRTLLVAFVPGPVTTALRSASTRRTLASLHAISSREGWVVVYQPTSYGQAGTKKYQILVFTVLVL